MVILFHTIHYQVLRHQECIHFLECNQYRQPFHDSTSKKCALFSGVCHVGPIHTQAIGHHGNKSKHVLEVYHTLSHNIFDGEQSLISLNKGGRSQLEYILGVFFYLKFGNEGTVEGFQSSICLQQQRQWRVVEVLMLWFLCNLLRQLQELDDGAILVVATSEVQPC